MVSRMFFSRVDVVVRVVWVGGGYLCFMFEDFSDFYECVGGVFPRGRWDGSDDFLDFYVVGDELGVFFVAYEAVFAFGPAPPFLGV